MPSKLGERQIAALFGRTPTPLFFSFIPSSQYISITEDKSQNTSLTTTFFLRMRNCMTYPPKLLSISRRAPPPHFGIHNSQSGSSVRV